MWFIFLYCYYTQFGGYQRVKDSTLYATQRINLKESFAMQDDRNTPNPPIMYRPTSRQEQSHQTNEPKSQTKFHVCSSGTIVLSHRGSPSRATLHHDPRSRTARPTSVPTRTAPTPLPTGAGEPPLRTSTGSCSRSVGDAGHRHRDAIAVHGNCRGGHGAGRQAAVSAHLAAAAVVVGAALEVTRRTLRGCHCDGGGCRCCTGDGG